MTRGPGVSAKVSVHASGQVHMRIEERESQRFAPPIALIEGRWAHALEIRFLLSPDADLPPPVKLRNRDRAYAIDVPERHKLILNLLISISPVPSDEALPKELSAGTRPIWRASLQDGRQALLAARIMPMKDQDDADIAFIRRKVNPRLNYHQKGPPNRHYLEVHNVAWSGDGGNIIAVVPMGKEAFREPEEPSAVDSDKRVVPVLCPDASIDISAPDKSVVAKLSLAGCSIVMNLRKNERTICSNGRLSLKVDWDRLVQGQKFKRPAQYMMATPVIAGAEPGGWAYPVRVQFDGQRLSIRILSSSAALRNVNLPQPMPNVLESEEVLIAAPSVNETVLIADRGEADPSTSLDMSLWLREH